MEKIDFKKQYKDLYTASAKAPKIIKVPRLQYLMVDGQGDPNTSPDFHAAIGALYGAAYTAKFMFKEKAEVPDYVVPPLQGLWWADDLSAFVENRREEWLWTLMILAPEWFTKLTLKACVAACKEKADKKKELVPPQLDQLRLEKMTEGQCVQMLHIGPYENECGTIEKMFAFMQEQGLACEGRHHEIYLSDPRRTQPEKLKTILRHPVKKQ